MKVGKWSRHLNKLQMKIVIMIHLMSCPTFRLLVHGEYEVQGSEVGQKELKIVRKSLFNKINPNLLNRITLNLLNIMPLNLWNIVMPVDFLLMEKSRRPTVLIVES